MKWRVASVVALAIVAAMCVTVWIGQALRPTVNSDAARAAVAESADRAAFDRWLAQSRSRAAEFAALEAYIDSQGMSDILPTWKLMRANVAKSLRCRAPTFIMPPRRSWPNILPALRIIRRHVVPAVGRVDVASVFRDPTLNHCSNGARQSRHLTFAAIDLVPLDQPDAPTSFRHLCAAWRRAGVQSVWGLGAYYDPANIGQNRVARFHVDGTGWRTWGFSYGRASSGCNAL